MKALTYSFLQHITYNTELQIPLQPDSTVQKNDTLNNKHMNQWCDSGLSLYYDLLNVLTDDQHCYHFCNPV